jgi:predicted NBD/HSP70 family sugar kinase
MGNAGDIGLIPVPPSTLTSAPQPNGEWDILLNRASINTLIRHLRACGHEVHSFSDVNFLVDRQDRAVNEWMTDCVAALTPVLWAGVALLNSPVVVIASDLGTGFIQQLITKLEQKLESSAPEARTPPQLLSGSLGSDAEAIGAANLPFFYHFSTQNHID